MRAGDAQACIKQSHAVKHRCLAMMYLCTSDVVTDVRGRDGMNGRWQKLLGGDLGSDARMQSGGNG